MIDACPDSAVLFFDVDGTLTSFDPDDMTDKDFNAIHPSKAVVDAFGRLRNAGHQAFICTGRPLWLVADGLRALNPAGIVAMAGATLEVEGRVVHEDCIDETLLRSSRAALLWRAARRCSRRTVPPIHLSQLVSNSHFC